MKLTFVMSDWDNLIVTCLGRFGHVHPPDAAAATSVTDPLACPILSADMTTLTLLTTPKRCTWSLSRNSFIFYWAAAATSVTDPLAWLILGADNPDLFNVFNIKILDALEVFREIFFIFGWAIHCHLVIEQYNPFTVGHLHLTKNSTNILSHLLSTNCFRKLP